MTFEFVAFGFHDDITLSNFGVPVTITIEQISEPTPELRALIGELDDVLNAAYEPHQRHGLAIAQLFEPHVRFFLARLDGAAVACGGVALFDDYAEVKRMYTRPAVRGRGVAKAVLRRLEDEARVSGKAVVRLETGQHQRKRSAFIAAPDLSAAARLAITRKCPRATLS
jgi:putative acetyltransferase